MCEALALTEAWDIVTAFIGAKDSSAPCNYADLASATLPISELLLGLKENTTPFEN